MNFDNYSQSIDAGVLITTNLITLKEVKHRQINSVMKSERNTCIITKDPTT